MILAPAGHSTPPTSSGSFASATGIERRGGLPVVNPEGTPFLSRKVAPESACVSRPSADDHVTAPRPSWNQNVLGRRHGNSAGHGVATTTGGEVVAAAGGAVAASP